MHQYSLHFLVAFQIYVYNEIFNFHKHHSTHAVHTVTLMERIELTLILMCNAILAVIFL